MFIRYQKVRNATVGTVAAVAASVGTFFGLKSMNDDGGNIEPSPRTIARRAEPSEIPSSRSPKNNPATAAPARLAQPKNPDRKPTTETPAAKNPAGTNLRNSSPRNPATTGQSASSEKELARYRSAMRIANAPADRSGKGKDVLGSGHPWKLNLYDDNRNGRYERAKLDKNRDNIDDEKWNFKNQRWEKDDGKTVWNNGRWLPADSSGTNSSPVSEKLALYRQAMSLATGRANRDGKGKDVLGAGSKWKLNLYDDDLDGKYDRGKLDINRDEIDDEKWTFKNGRWEKEDGRFIWSDNQWVEISKMAKADNATKYRSAFQIISLGSRPTAAQKKMKAGIQGKDVLGSANSWKLNLYDDDPDGIWDRAKLDVNRDNVDDQKWTNKNGSWQRDNTDLVWSGSDWVRRSKLGAPATPSGNATLDRYRSAMKIAAGRADASGKGKDVLGSASPWKLNLYDDDKDGMYDRGKLDTNRDDVDDEKWTRKNGQWQRDDSDLVWSGNNWAKRSASASSTGSTSVSPAKELIRYRSAMKIATSRAHSSGKGKDVLGSSSPWKLNLYDDNKDGIWDRGKLDLNRDDVDDEKWNFKDGRWEKDGGAKIWDGSNWVQQ